MRDVRATRSSDWVMRLTDQERVLLLAAMFEAKLTYDELALVERCEALDRLAEKLGGNVHAVLYGIDPTELP